MTGLVAAVAPSDVTPMLVEGLRRLEYRRYDSAGIALLHGAEGRLDWRRCVGSIRELEGRLAGVARAHAGIAHTRHATVGPPAERNAHPQVSHGTVAVAQNGDISNYRVVRSMLEAKGYEFHSDTDAEVIAHLVHDFHKKRRGLLHAVRDATHILHGRYAVAVAAAAEPDLVVACHGSPLVIGLGLQGQWATSDAAALPAWVRRTLHLADGDVAELRGRDLGIIDRYGRSVTREPELRAPHAIPPEPVTHARL